MQELIVITDLDGVIGRVNRAVVEKVGKGFREILGKHIQETFGDIPFRVDEAGVPRPAEVTLPFSDRIYQMSCFPNVDPDGHRIGTIFVFRDVSDEKRMRERLLEAEKLSMLSAVLRGVAHELNNPLAGVLGFAQLALELSSDPAVNECLRIVQAEAERVTKIVRSLIEFARRSQPKPMPVWISEVFERCRDLLAYEMRLARLTLSVSMPAALPPVLGDPQQLQQVFVPILLLAVRHARQHGKGGAVLVEAQEGDSGFVTIRIETEGPDLSEAEVEHLLDLPGHTSQSEEVGIALVQSFVTQHGGSVKVERRAEGGLLFTLELPKAQEPGTSEGLPDEEVLPNLAGAQVLVADDDIVTARLVQSVLEKAGATVRVVEDGKAALQAMKERRYDLSVVDVRMPGMDAREFLAKLRTGEDMPGRIVLMSGDILALETLGLIESSGLPFVPKPFTVSALRAAIRKALG